MSGPRKGATLNAPVGPFRRRLRRAFYRVALTLLAPFLKVQYGLRVTGAPTGDLSGCVVVANHACMLDAPMVAVAARPCRLHFMSLAENGTHPVYGPLVRALGSIFVEGGLAGGRRMVRRCHEVLDDGDALAVYPEGELTPYNRTVGPFKEGAFRIAAARGCPVVPVALVQRPDAVCLNRLLGRPGWELVVGEPVSPDGPDARSSAAAMARAAHDFIAGALARAEDDGRA